jgi:hypothetical protein
MMGVLINDPNTPPLVMLKLPPLMSSSVSVPSFAFVANARMAASMPANDMRSASRSTGTTRPSSAATAMPMS